MTDTPSSATKRRLKRPDLSPVLLSQPAAWRYCGLTRSAWFALKSTGSLPAAVFLPTSSRPFYRREELDVWAKKLPTSRRDAVTVAGTD